MKDIKDLSERIVDINEAINVPYKQSVSPINLRKNKIEFLYYVKSKENDVVLINENGEIVADKDILNRRNHRI